MLHAGSRRSEISEGQRGGAVQINGVTQAALEKLGSLEERVARAQGIKTAAFTARAALFDTAIAPHLEKLLARQLEAVEKQAGEVAATLAALHRDLGIPPAPTHIEATLAADVRRIQRDLRNLHDRGTGPKAVLGL